LGTGFNGSNDPTNSVKALKEVVVLWIRLQFHEASSPHYNNTQNTHTQKWI